ncbi:MAG: hypothetical protein RR623_10410 [Bacilli bacterium]
MNNIENSIKSVIEEKMQDGTVEKVIVEQFEKALNNAVESMFTWNGDGKKLIEDKIRDTMIPIISSFDFSKYLVNLEVLLSQILSATEITENMKIMKNFGKLAEPIDSGAIVTISNIFEKYCDYVAKNVSTDDLEVDYDDGVHYENVDVCFDFEQIDKEFNSSYYERATIIFKCDKDDDLNFEIPLRRWKREKDNNWEIEFNTTPNIYSLKHLNDFEIYIVRLMQSRCHIEIDTECDADSVTPEAEPEATYC